jgi:hypothetical protein
MLESSSMVAYLEPELRRHVARAAIARRRFESNKGKAVRSYSCVYIRLWSWNTHKRKLLKS